MKDGVKWETFPAQEYRNRIDRAKQILGERGIDAMLLFAPTNWQYYGGFTDALQMHNGIWRTCLIVRADAEPVAVAHLAFMGSIQTQSYLEDVRWVTDLATEIRGGIPESFYTQLFSLLEELGLASAVLGFETGCELQTYLSHDEYDRIRNELPNAKIVSADAAIWQQRAIKTPWEQDVMREGARLSCECVQTAFDMIRPGVNERDIHQAFWTKAAELGMIEAPYNGGWTCFSTNRHEPMGMSRWNMGPVDRIIEIGDHGTTDGGPQYKGYRYDFQRTFHVGAPPPKMLKYHEIATGAHLECIAAIKPGMQMREVYQASVDALGKRGYNLDMPHIISFIGHQEGLGHHEPPWINGQEEALVEVGMVMAIEVGAFDPEAEIHGSMPEDLVLVTENGPEIITHHLSHDLFIAE